MTQCHLARRQNPLKPQIAVSVVEGWLGCVAERFGKAWLESAGGAPLQQLWMRRDALATSELATLGSALQALAPHRNWLDGQIQIVKGKDANNAAGALFEILALGQIDLTRATLHPAKASQAGFDGTLHFAPAGKLFVSLKRYGTSMHQVNFNREAARLRNRVSSALKTPGSPGMSVVGCFDHYPKPIDWSRASQFLDRITTLSPGDTLQEDGLYLRVGLLSDQLAPVAVGSGSHTVQFFAPFHHNEADNLCDKLLDGCRNLAKHGRTESSLSSNVVYVHVPASASIAACQGWVQEWFDSFPEKPVSAVLLYQPSVVRNSDNQSHIHHSVCLVSRRKGETLLTDNPSAVPGIVLPVGTVGSAPSEERLVLSEGQSLSMTGHYVFQQGDIYCEMVETAEGTHTGDLTSPASGIRVHALWTPPGGAKRFAFQAILPDVEVLLIL